MHSVHKHFSIFKLNYFSHVKANEKSTKSNLYQFFDINANIWQLQTDIVRIFDIQFNFCNGILKKLTKNSSKKAKAKNFIPAEKNIKTKNF